MKDMLINLLSRDKADEIQLAAAKWYLLKFDFCNFHYLVPSIDVHFPTFIHMHAPKQTMLKVFHTLAPWCIEDICPLLVLIIGATKSGMNLQSSPF